MPGSLRHVAAAGQLPPELGSAWVVSVHLDVDDETVRTAQAREAATWGVLLDPQATNVFIGGDFNDTPAGSAYASLPAYGYHDGSVVLPADGIDHIFVHRAAPWSVQQAMRLFDGVNGPAVSDHPGVLVSFAAAAATPVPRPSDGPVHAGDGPSPVGARRHRAA